MWHVIAWIGALFFICIIYILISSSVSARKRLGRIRMILSELEERYEQARFQLSPELDMHRLSRRAAECSAFIRYLDRFSLTNSEVLQREKVRLDTVWQALLGLHDRATRTAMAGAQHTSEIERLAALRNANVITHAEFDAFSEKFKVSSTAKIRDMIAAIDELAAAYKSGAMGEGNYHEALWSLLDKLERIT